jgi:hypothetical protein
MALVPEEGGGIQVTVASPSPGNALTSVGAAGGKPPIPLKVIVCGLTDASLYTSNFAARGPAA